jgi:GTP-binding protein
MVCNKWDLVDDERRVDFERELDRLLSFASWAPRVNVSAATARGTRRQQPHLPGVWESYRRRIPTRELNQVIADATAHHAPPRRGNRPLRIRYVTQAEVAPPRIVLFANGPVPDGYRRYLERQLRERYGFVGVPLLIDDRPPPRRSRGRQRRR